MIAGRVNRRRLLGGSAALAAAALVGRGSPAWAAVQDANDLKPVPLPPPIAAAERVARLTNARTLMQRQGIGAVLVESGPSLDYYTGIQW
jgi:Xaa-Pro dipeptidase